MKHKILRNAFLAGLSFLAIVSLNSCGHKEDHDHGGHDHESEISDHDDDHAHDGHRHSPDDIIMDTEKAKAAGIEVQTAERGTFHDVILVSGSITAASCDETTVIATVSGVVSHSQHLSEGMPIQQGSVIYSITSDKLQNGDPIQRARINYLAAKREYDRTLPLVEEHLITQAEFSSIRTEYENARLTYEAIKNETTPKGVVVKAPASGYMKNCMVKDGDYVEMGTPLMTITRNQHLNLRAEVPARHYDVLGKIRSAKFRTQYSDQVIDLQNVNGHLMSSGKSAESTSSYVPVTFQFDNTGGIFPGSYAEVYLITGERQGVLSVPTTALTEEQGIYYIYIKKGADSFHKQEVQLGATDGEYTEIILGLDGGEEVVVRGAINVKLASASNAIPAHTHNH